MVHIVTKVAEYAIITNDENEFRMVQWGSGFNYTWHFPGGRLEEGDREIEGLKREVREELVVELTGIKPAYAKYIQKDDKWINHPRYALFYLARIKEGSKIKLDESEHKSYKWYKKEDMEKIDFWLPFYKEMLKKILPF